MSDAEYTKTKVIKWLLNGNLSFDCSRDAIGAEVLFSENRRSADLLILSNEFHALEIKGDLDDPRKLGLQLIDYHRTFDKVSVITTRRHIDKICKCIKPYTGLILFDKDTFEIIKLAKRRKRLDKYSLLMFLNRNELNGLLSIRKNKIYSTDELRSLISKRLTIDKIRQVAYSTLKKRYGELFRLFLKDMGDNIIWDEIRGLSGRIEELYV